MRKPMVTVLAGFLLVLVERSVNAQFPFGGGMIPGMQNFMQDMRTMMSELQAMSRRLQAEARARQQYIHSILPDLKPGEGRDFENGTIRGYAYRKEIGSLPSAMQHMNKVKADLRAMSQSLKLEGQKLQAEGQRIQAEGQMLSQKIHAEGRMLRQKIKADGQRIRAKAEAHHKHIESLLPDLKPGEDSNFINGTIRGYAYRSPNGHYNYHILTGSQSHGYIYHSGPDGTYERRW